MPLKKTGGLTLDTIQDYFMQLNPIAQRIACDIRDTKSAYGQLWYTLKPNEQNNIINETLIRPEIAIKYFDSISKQSSSSTSSSFPVTNTPSTDSLTATVLQNLKSACDEVNSESAKTKQNDDKLNLRNFSTPQDIHEFDGQNLKSFVFQKVALKIIQDDTVGTYRDEHSRPFSFRTKSQIDLNVFCGNENANDNTFLNDTHIRLINTNAVTDFYFKTKGDLPEIAARPLPAPYNTQDEFKNSMQKQTNESEIYPSNKDYKLPLKVCSLKSTSKKPVDKSDKMFSSNGNSNSFSVKSLKVPQMSYVLYGEDYKDTGENSNLVKYKKGLFNDNSSSTTASEDEENDEETLCEEVNLLDTDISIKRGFDFLNNW